MRSFDSIEKLPPPLFLDILKQGGEFFNRVILDILIQDLGYRRAEGARKILRFKQADNDFLQCHQGIRIVQGPKFFARLRRELLGLV